MHSRVFEWQRLTFLQQNLENKVRMSEGHLFQIWCLYLSYKESYDQKTARVSFLVTYDVLHYMPNQSCLDVTK